ncbi:hypothetical protein LAV82_22925 [Bacillus sp. ILBB4]|nr:hypothetical protein [Bacillus sp. ILBB4]
MANTIETSTISVQEKPPIVMQDITEKILPLYKYPNVMKRNARYRGHRESEKVLNDHQEQAYDIRRLYKDISYTDSLKDQNIFQWFHGLDILSISTIQAESEQDLVKTVVMQEETELDPIRTFADNVINLSGNSSDENIVGIYDIKRRMQELDERIAEAERRYEGYENAYE